MANLLGMDGEAWTNRALVEKFAGTTKGERLAAALGKALLVTGAAIASSGASAATEAGLYLIRCIERLSFRTPSAVRF